MNMFVKIITVVGILAVIALVVYAAGEFALSGSPLLALLPVAALLTAIVVYIRRKESQNKSD
jgi:uncharacterized membrane protein